MHHAVTELSISQKEHGPYFNYQKYKIVRSFQRPIFPTLFSGLKSLSIDMEMPIVSLVGIIYFGKTMTMTSSGL